MQQWGLGQLLGITSEALTIILVYMSITHIVALIFCFLFAICYINTLQTLIKFHNPVKPQSNKAS